MPYNMSDLSNKINPSAFAEILWPLYAKCAIRCSEPMRWRGGEICALPKVQHPGAQADQYRSSSLQTTCLRKDTACLGVGCCPPWIHIKAPCKLVESLIWAQICCIYMYRVLRKSTKNQGQSGATLYIAIRQAFYTCVAHFSCTKGNH